MVELQSGKIEIDGSDISRIGLGVLRGRLALVPQDSTLFLGTLRENLYVLIVQQQLSPHLFSCQ
jgi:ABC-type multidrug transport system fused ATPase/permease subunit